MTETTVLEDSNQQKHQGAEAASKAERKEATWAQAGMFGLLMALVASLFISAFLWPMTTATPKDIDLGIAGPAEATAGIEQVLATNGKDTFNVTNYENAEAATDAIKAREVSGAVVVSADGIQVLTASAGNAQASQLLTQMASGIQTQMQQAGQTVPVAVEDVVPAGSTGAAANFTILPALIAGLTGSVVAFLLVQRPSRRIATLLVASVGAGLLGALLVGPAFNVLPGNYWMMALAIGTGAMAVGSFISGLGALLGAPGLGLGALTIVLFGNPWGGMMMPSEFLPTPWSTIGSFMPNGAIINLMKSIGFFPEASTGREWLILLVWIAVGLTMLAAGSYLHHRKNLVDGAQQA